MNRCLYRRRYYFCDADTAEKAQMCDHYAAPKQAANLCAHMNDDECLCKAARQECGKEK